MRRQLIEMGMLEGMMQLFEDATSQSNEEIKQYLQSTRQGNSQEMSRHLNLIPISVMRILRNATCLLLHNFNLQPRDGQNIRRCRKAVFPLLSLYFSARTIGFQRNMEVLLRSCCTIQD
mmetsp:Transcript_20103/g.66881  ORF Transcript_20103/g.66881 Transcript_20103/m.66881 type:complete len:119 (+) Transcript_20103:1063-1419(+)